MNELLGFFTAMGMMVTGPSIPCQTQIDQYVQQLAKADKLNRRNDLFAIDHREIKSGLYGVNLHLRKKNGNERSSNYVVTCDRECRQIRAKKE
jgi:hypothetical protein